MFNITARSFSKILVPALALGALIGSAAVSHAQVYFNYSVTYTDASGTATAPATATLATTDPANFFTVTPGIFTTGAQASAFGTQLGLLTVNPVAPAGSNPASITDTSFTTVTTLYRTDQAGNRIGADATFTVTGLFSGRSGPGTGVLGGNTDTVTITNVTGLPTTVSSGGADFNLVLDSVRNPGLPNTVGNSGGITLFVTSPQAAVPEPGAVAMLVGMGTTGLGLVARRRRK